MSHRFYILFLISLFVLSGNSIVYAQKDESSSIMVLAQSFGDSVIIRWAPSKASDWRLLNNYGYRLERYTIIRDSAILEPKPVKQLNEKPVKPAPLNSWAALAKNDDHATVAAQAIFGDSFEVSTGKGNSIAEVINKSKELDMRYSMALFSCDVSSLAARLSGLRWVDKTTKKNEKYLYRIHSLVPEQLSKIDFGFAYVSPGKASKLPVPRSPELRVKGFTVSVDFDSGPLNNVYSGYQFEQSADGKSFQLINRSIAVATHQEGKTSNLIHLVDTLNSFEPKYYRVRGLTPFGIWGPYSEPAKATAKVYSNVHASIENAISSADTLITITWKFPLQEESKITGFDVERAKSSSGPYAPIAKTLAPKARTYVDHKPIATNYYRVVSVDNSGNRTSSFPFLVQLADSIPPATPNGLKFTIDTVGRVGITWAKNKEPDLSGYHVYRSNFSRVEFSRVTKGILLEPAFSDTINLGNLTNKIYYKVAAFDKRNNQSLYSITLTIRKPDIAAPVPPAIYSIRQENDSVKIKWHSVSADLKNNIVYRKEKSETTWKEVAKTKASDKWYTESPSLDGTYRYKIVAEDSAANKSTSPEVEIHFVRTGKSLTVKFNQPKIDREKKQIELSWRYSSSTEPLKIQIYRAIAEGGYSLYKVVAGTTLSWIDEKVAIETKYKYKFVAVLKTGKISPMGNELIIDF